MLDEATQTTTETTASAEPTATPSVLDASPSSPETETGTAAAVATDATAAETALTTEPVSAAPEKYELVAPEGFALDADAAALADPVFRELNLTNDQANKLMPVASEFAKRIADQTRQSFMGESAAIQKQWVAEAQSDPVIGGSHWDASIATAGKALDLLGATKDSSFRQFLTNSGLGNHPDMIRMFVKVGNAIGEGGEFSRANGAPQVQRSRAEILYDNR